MKPEHKKYILDHMDKLSVKRMSQALNIKAKTIWEFLEHHKKNDARPDPDVLPQNTEIPAKKKSSFPPFILIIILGFAVYGNSLNNEFLWDDELLIVTNDYTTGQDFNGAVAELETYEGLSLQKLKELHAGA